LIYRSNDIDLPLICVVLFSYGFEPTELHSYSAPIVRVATGRLYNHGSLAVYAQGRWWLLESAENGPTQTPLEEAIDRHKARIEIRPYTGDRTPSEVMEAAGRLLGKKYDYWALSHQLVYRSTRFVAVRANNFIGHNRFKGLWIGKTGDAAGGTYGCFEFVFSVLGLPEAHLASGWEFEEQYCFGPAIFSELK
jgi:hypothetical protein